jgi:hypothetical protein
METITRSCMQLGPPQSPCKLAHKNPDIAVGDIFVRKIADADRLLGYLVFGLRRCAVVMESSNIC